MDTSTLRVALWQCYWIGSLWPDKLMVYWTMSVHLKCFIFFQLSVRKTMCRSWFLYYIILLFWCTGLSVMVCQDFFQSVELHFIILYKFFCYSVKPLFLRTYSICPDTDVVIFCIICQESERTDANESQTHLWTDSLYRVGKLLLSFSCFLLHTSKWSPEIYCILSWLMQCDISTSIKYLYVLCILG